MRSLVVVIVDPWLQVRVSLLGVSPVFCIGPFAERGLDKALCFSVCSWRIRSSAGMLDGHLLAGFSKQLRAITGTVVGKQCAYADSVRGKELHS